MQTGSTMPKVIAKTVITNLVGIRLHGTALTKNSMRKECVKIAISTTTTGKEGRVRQLRI